MSKVSFQSVLAVPMGELVDFKRMQGYEYTAQALVLRHFDRFLVQQGWSAQRLSSDLLQLYVRRTEGLAPNTRHARLSVARVFSRFLRTCEPDSAMLHAIPVKRPSQPRFYLYSEEEIKALLVAALQLGPRGHSRRYRFHMLIGLIAVTGLRISEALALESRDLELDYGRLFVRKGKFGKERYVALHSSTVARLRTYLDIMQPHRPDGPRAPLFPNRKGKPMGYRQTANTFHALCRHACVGIGAPQPPRLHDLRHTHACNCLEKWRREGSDVNAKLPFLTTAMGHSKIEHTQIYLHVTPRQLRTTSERLRNHLNQPAKGD